MSCVPPSSVSLNPELQPGRSEQSEAQRVAAVEVLEVPVFLVSDLAEHTGEVDEGPGVGVVDAFGETGLAGLVREELDPPRRDLPVGERPGIAQPSPDLGTGTLNDPDVLVDVVDETTRWLGRRGSDVEGLALGIGGIGDHAAIMAARREL